MCSTNSPTCSFDKDTKIWTSNKTEAGYNLNDSMGQILFDRLKKYPDNILQIDDVYNITITNSEALKWGISIVQYFKQLKLDQTDIIGICANNTSYILPLALGCFFNCNPFHALNPMLDEDTITHCFGLTKPKIIFCDGDDYQKIKISTKSFAPIIITVTEHLKEVPTILDLLTPTLTEESYQPEKLSNGPNQTVAILSSSGTTGKPKAVCLTTAGLFNENRFLNTETVFFVSSGLDWYTGLWYLINNCLSSCTRIISKKSFDADYFFELMEKYKISYTFLSSRYVAQIVNHPKATRESLASIYGLQIAGSALSEATLEKFISLFSEEVFVNFGYGLTELGTIAFNFDKAKTKSVGNLLPNLRLRIVDEDGNSLPANQIGEVYIHCPGHFNGYYGNPEETAKALDSDGWFHTGDLGYMDKENFLYLVNRKKETLKYKGYHYWPNEIENVIAEISDVTDVCVVSVFDESVGDSAGALVVKSENSSLSELDVIEYVKKHFIVPHKQLHAGVYFVQQLPYNFNNKVLRKEAQKILQSLVDNKK